VGLLKHQKTKAPDENFESQRARGRTGTRSLLGCPQKEGVRRHALLRERLLSRGYRLASSRGGLLGHIPAVAPHHILARPDAQMPMLSSP
jgi:hypothetical protein